MNRGDLRRVQEARQRLHAADATLGSDDAAIRIVELRSPRPGERSLPIDRAFCVVYGLSNAARQAVASTIDSVRSNNEDIGLDGIVETYGRRLPMHQASTIAPKVPGTAIVPAAAFHGRNTARTAEASLLHEVIDTIDRAVLLSSAELRGGDAAALELEERISKLRLVVPNETSAGKALEPYDVNDPNSADDVQVLAALDSVAPPAKLVARIHEALELVRNDPQRTRLEAAISQAAAAKAQVLPGDAKDVAMLADLAVAEADGLLAEYDMSPTSPAANLTSHLQSIGVAASQFEAPEMADRVLEESAELESIRARLILSIEQTQTSPELLQSLDERRVIDGRRLQIQRRLRSQQQLLAVAKEEARSFGIEFDDPGNMLDIRDGNNRPMPILIEEPLAEMPARLSGAILSTLLRHSAQTQVICVSDQLDLRQWCDSVGNRAGWVAASGWFSGRTNEC